MFQLIDRPVHMPGRTFCLQDTRGPVVDTGVDLNGWVYINRIEALEIGRLFGFVEGEVHEATLARILELETELADVRADLSAAEAQHIRVVSVDDIRAELTAT